MVANQICSHVHGTDRVLEDFMKDMQEVARFAVPSAPSPIELDRLCAEFEQKVKLMGSNYGSR